MKIVGTDREVQSWSPGLGRTAMSIHPSSSYDFIVSLRALYNGGTYKRARNWTSAARKAMSPRLYNAGRLFFEGGETALGYGLLPLIPTLGPASGPADFIECLKTISADRCALLMLDTGETSQEAMNFYRSVLERGGGHEKFEAKIREYAGAFADPSLEVLRDAAASKDSLVKFLEAYLEKVFAPFVHSFSDAVERAAASARDLLAMQPSLSSVEALTGGYTLSNALQMNEIILAPSIFIYPFMASRIDEKEGQALVVFGVRNDDLLGYRESGPEDVLDHVKALANPQRLEILALLRQGPLLGTEFVRRLELSQPTVHHHLAQLRTSGLIRQERTPDGMQYSYRVDAAESLVGELARFLGVDY